MSKKILHTLFALAAALILTGGFPMTAYAGGGEEYETEEPTPAPEPEETATPSDPLTPEGNATRTSPILTLTRTKIPTMRTKPIMTATGTIRTTPGTAQAIPKQTTGTNPKKRGF